jgi:hypothetical protein
MEQEERNDMYSSYSHLEQPVAINKQTNKRQDKMDASSACFALWCKVLLCGVTFRTMLK